MHIICSSEKTVGVASRYRDAVWHGCSIYEVLVLIKAQVCCLTTEHCQ